MGAWQREHLSLMTALWLGVRLSSLRTCAFQKGSRAELAMMGRFPGRNDRHIFALIVFDIVMASFAIARAGKVRSRNVATCGEGVGCKRQITYFKAIPPHEVHIRLVILAIGA